MVAAEITAYDVVVCGAGPAGLTLSILLSRFGVRHLLVERRDGTSPIPRARGIAHRTVEIWDRFGLTPALEALTLPPVWMRQMVYQETLAGPMVGAVPTPHSLPGAAAAFTPSNAYCISQDKTDALLREAAMQYSQATLRFGAEVVAVEQDGAGVDVSLATSSGTERVRCAWLVGCDGAESAVRERSGIANRTLKTMDAFVNAHYYADLSRWTAGREAPLLWNMREGCEGVFGPLDGKRFWRTQINYDPAIDAPDEWTADKVLARIRAMIGAPGAELPPLELHSFYPYTVRAGIADRFVHGRVILAGDAAHQIPPHGAMGMNTGVQTAHNLAWKLAGVVNGTATPALLETYECERREVANRVIDHAIGNFARMKKIRDESTPEQRRDAVRNAKAYGNALGLDLGVHYERPGAFVPDDAPAPSSDVTAFTPSAKPGYRAPHVPLGVGASTIHLFDRSFVLLTGRSGDAWVEAARAPIRGIPLESHRIADDGAAFEAAYGIDADGAVLVRPDGHVAFRRASCPADPQTTLNGVLERILRIA